MRVPNLPKSRLLYSRRTGCVCPACMLWGSPHPVWCLVECMIYEYIYCWNCNLPHRIPDSLSIIQHIAKVLNRNPIWGNFIPKSTDELFWKKNPRRVWQNSIRFTLKFETFSVNLILCTVLCHLSNKANIWERCEVGLINHCTTNFVL